MYYLKRKKEGAGIFVRNDALLLTFLEKEYCEKKILLLQNNTKKKQKISTLAIIFKKV